MAVPQMDACDQYIPTASFYLQQENEEKLVTIGDYEFYYKDKLGEGSFGSVFSGLKTSTGDRVALKLIATCRLKHDELEATIKAQSECVVRFYDVVKTDSLIYIIMELCDTDLARFLATYGKLTPENLLTVGRCLAEGYTVLHRHGIVHRDIKPQNVLLTLENRCSDPIGQPKILVAKFADFGSSRISDSSSGSGDDQPCNLAGTFFYMAPEVGANVVDRHYYDHAVDMWSLGVLLYQCIAGNVPFDERQLCKLFLHAIDGNDAGYEPPVPPDCPEIYEHVICKLLQLNPSKRLKPVQLHSLLAHDEPAAFVQCLNQGSCSDAQKVECGKDAMKIQHTDTWTRRVSLERLPSFRRTASAFFEKLISVCGQQYHKKLDVL